MSPRDESRLKGVHPDLLAVLDVAFNLFSDESMEINGLKLFVIEGVRTPIQQARMVKIGASKTLNSRHLTGHAVDLGLKIDGRMLWEFPAYKRLWEFVMKPAAELQRVPLEWGGDWPRLRDGPHFQLPWADYPLNKPKERKA